MNVGNLISVEVSSAHVCNEDQERIHDTEHTFRTRSSEQISLGLQEWCCCENLFDSLVGALSYTSNASGGVELQRSPCLYRSI